MARTVRTKIYKFNELSEQAKEKAIEKFYDTNVDYDWWDSVYEDFKMFCETIGVYVDRKKTWFSGFSSQGDGAAFTADIDLKELIEGIKDKKYLAHAPKTEEETGFKPDPCPVNWRVLDLIDRNWISIGANVKGKERPYRSELYFNSDYTYNECVNYKRIDAELEKLEEWIQETINDLTSHLYKLLERDYEWRTSKEQIVESIVSNEYEFTADGKQWY